MQKKRKMKKYALKGLTPKKNSEEREKGRESLLKLKNS